jgi:hypothetical protein
MRFGCGYPMGPLALLSFNSRPSVPYWVDTSPDASQTLSCNQVRESPVD